MTVEQVSEALAGARRVRISVECEPDVAITVYRDAEWPSGLVKVYADLVRDAITVERIPDPEPTERGAVVMDRRGRVWVRYANHPEGNPWQHVPGGDLLPRWSAWADLDDPRPVIRDER
jgi:hypothetical protein